ncbi:MAG: hypothetical protein M0R06_16415 [Sphaerochaeta sp.]|jgi:hypothetical protein|nr:hypothetical protein [Sphaerochaeta sp.]
MKSARIREIAEELATLSARYEAGQEELGLVREDLDLTARQLQRLKLEDEGWLLLQGSSEGEDGPTLDQIHDMSRILRAAVAESPLPKQANNLRSSYAFSEKFIVPGLDGSTEPAKRGAPSEKAKTEKALRDFASSRTARQYVFGKNAQELISTACSTDGVYFLLGDDDNKTVHAVPVREITGVYTNEDFPDEIWAYQRQWGSNPVKKAWYYTDAFDGVRRSSLPESANSIEEVRVDKSKTMIALTVNNQTGWAWGVPDLWAGHVWSRNYLVAIKDGLEVTGLMAWLSAKVKKQSQTGSDAVGVKVGAGGKAGSVQTYGQGNSIDTYATTGKAYDFDALRPLASLYALAAGVSVVDLLASPSAAGASYGSAQALAPGMRRAIAVRREKIAAWMERVFEWATGTYHQVTPASIEEVEPYRKTQMIDLAWRTGLFHDDEIRPELAYQSGITLKHAEKPDGYLTPNNEKSLPRKDIDTDANPTPTKTSPGAKQGKSDGTGGQGSTAANDQRTDTIS